MERPGGALHQQQRRAQSFGGDAELYDRARPGYPAAVARGLCAGAGSRVLDVGAGTGKASEVFRDAGCSVLGLEPDERMAAVARAKGLAVEIDAFETWEAEDRHFEFVVAGQAWHWVDPLQGPVKAWAVLEPGGRLAPFWNYRRQFDPEIQQILRAPYRRIAPALIDGSVTGGVSGNGGQTTRETLEQLRASPYFAEPEVQRHHWSRRYLAAQWCALVDTFSDHRLLEPGQRTALIEAVGEAIERIGGELVVDYETVVVSAMRR